MFLEFVKNRYSCRAFSDRPIEEEKIRRIIEAGIAAPTAVNKQPYKIFRVKSKEAVSAIHKTTKYTFGASEFLIVGSMCDEAWVRPFDNMNFADVDASIAATHIMLAVKAEGLDTTWVGHFDAPKLKKLIPELSAYNLIALFPIGYAAEDAKPSKKHESRKSVEESVTEI